MEDIVSRAFKERKCFLLLTVALHILIITSLFHRTSLGKSATFPLNGYRGLLHVCVESNYKWRVCKDYQRSQKIMGLLV